VVVQFGKEASQTRDYCVAKGATLRAARPDPSLRKERLFRMTGRLHHCKGLRFLYSHLPGRYTTRSPFLHDLHPAILHPGQRISNQIEIKRGKSWQLWKRR
jgi:hypothetical protein